MTSWESLQKQVPWWSAWAEDLLVRDALGRVCRIPCPLQEGRLDAEHPCDQSQGASIAGADERPRHAAAQETADDAADGSALGEAEAVGSAPADVGESDVSGVSGHAPDFIEGLVRACSRVSGVQHDSRQVQSGDAFVAIPGAASDGHDFAAQAHRAGAVLLVVERWVQVPIMQIAVRNARRVLGPLAHAVQGHPSARLDVIGVTGTNGKSTIVELVRCLLDASGSAPMSLGTLGVRGLGVGPARDPQAVRGPSPSEIQPGGAARHEGEAEPAVVSAFLPGRSGHTTPEADDIALLARRAVDGGNTHLVMEVSSHAIALHRIDGMRFRVQAFSNLSQDHLDFHGTMARYWETKQRFFLERDTGTAVIHVGQEEGRALADALEARGRTVIRVANRMDLRSDITLTLVPSQEGSDPHPSVREGSCTRWFWHEAGQRIDFSMPGTHNGENLAVALGCMQALGLDCMQAWSEALQQATLPGRLERVDAAGRGFEVFVDYAHTPGALAAVLSGLRLSCGGRIIVVFGAGGNRDRDKRHPMGATVAAHANCAVLTDDNPRHEDPQEIAAMVADGLRDGGMRLCEKEADFSGSDRRFMVELDRARAIHLALGSARRGDVVVIAGKGHESYQRYGSVDRAFDDREVARDALRKLGPADDAKGVQAARDPETQHNRVLGGNDIAESDRKARGGCA